MKKFFGLSIIVLFLFALSGCDDLFTDPVEETSIQGHSIEWDRHSGKPVSITIW